MKDIILNVKKRILKGKLYSKKIRRLNIIPCILYGKKIEPIKIEIDKFQIENLLKIDFYYSKIINLKFENEKKSIKTIIKDIQRHPYKRNIIHLDFESIDGIKNIKIFVPVILKQVDKCLGLKVGGFIVHKITEIQIACKLSNIIKAIYVDVKSLKINESIFVKNIILPKGIKIILNKINIKSPVVTIKKVSKIIEKEDDSEENNENIKDKNVLEKSESTSKI